MSGDHGGVDLPRRYGSLMRTVRALSMPLLTSAARVVGPSIGFRAADAMAWRRALLTRSGLRELRRQRRAFPHRRDQMTLLASRSAVPARNRVVMGQLLSSRPVSSVRPDDTVVPVATQALLATRQSFVLAVGHFGFESMLPVVDHLMRDRTVTIVVGSAVTSDQPRWERWSRTRAEEMIDLGMERHGFKKAPRGSIATVRKLVATLGEEGQVVLVFADADLSHLDWPGAVRRPFAARSEVSFGTGAAQLGRLAQAPVVVLTPCHMAGGHGSADTACEWSEPIGPAPRRRRAQDAEITDAVLDVIERAVGRCPDRYASRIGGSRAWDPTTETWVGAARA